MKMFDFTAMNKKKRDLYECMWGSAEFDFLVEKTECRGAESSNSYMFSGASTVDKEKCSERLVELFQITDKDLFRQKFSQSISGSGQELKRIATLHSSSLCALLFFYQVTEENPYSMKLDGEEYVFTYSCFEYQNQVIKGRNPSNMDVVLVGRHKNNGTPVVLFLESKFSEYYERTGKQLKDIASAYLDNEYSKSVYRSNCLADMGLHIVEEQGNPNFSLVSDKISYLEGMKQMISHYVGVRNFCNGERVIENNKIEDVDKIEDAVLGEAKILLGEILFELPMEAGKRCLDSYQKNYRILAKELNRQIAHDGKGGQITILSDVLSYSQFRKNACIKEERIKKFYFESGVIK